MNYVRNAILDAIFVVNELPSANPTTRIPLQDASGRPDLGRDESLQVILGGWANSISGEFSEQEMCRVRSAFVTLRSKPESTAVADCCRELVRLLSARGSVNKTA